MSNLQLQAKQRVVTELNVMGSVLANCMCLLLGKNEQCNRKAMTLFGHLVKQQVICLKRQREREDGRGTIIEESGGRKSRGASKRQMGYETKSLQLIQADLDKWHNNGER